MTTTLLRSMKLHREDEAFGGTFALKWSRNAWHGAFTDELSKESSVILRGNETVCVYVPGFGLILCGEMIGFDCK
jgi:hypothetical protein